MSVRALFIGGAGSGKSAAGEELAGRLGGERVLYVATAGAGDEEMERRIAAHRRRRPAGWETLEAGGDLAPVLKRAAGMGAVLLDSLTLWVSGRMLEGAGDEEILESLDRFLRRAGSAAEPFVVVTDEVGQGVVPESAAGRRFRDLLGAANRRAAAAAGEVYLCVAGIPVRIK
ncbi:bifunctional adenosylcobinamide kinase/adenosylcobinamide-phosphate guanylyltransferase [Rubrobacter taiwanensis]|uniref:Adenosylcobinamide kinase n=1 Tax=Rubrobacter taiwanensis TaxID=185139 RepID=A0A4R1B9N6_9ACTN|nr:bifunctional adenosylcobinamide kinase/adenosylcobinamide-phosphate guanylyltransferase [Rubrobacter taiwanensis]TCJ13636.1 bifunctional adenosylcobinamide kinase/adenosylcobinamide-phosphate guanylyltransferase [Rubrobacter taiwanensis]